MITGIVIAIGIGLIVVGGGGATDASTELYPDRKLVTMFIIMFLAGMSMVGGGLGSLA